MTVPPEPWGFLDGFFVGVGTVALAAWGGTAVSDWQQGRRERRRERRCVEARASEAAIEALIAQSHDSQALLRQACDDLIAFLEAERPGDPPADAP